MLYWVFDRPIITIGLVTFTSIFIGLIVILAAVHSYKHSKGLLRHFNSGLIAVTVLFTVLIPSVVTYGVMQVPDYLINQELIYKKVHVDSIDEYKENGKGQCVVSLHGTDERYNVNKTNCPNLRHSFEHNDLIKYKTHSSHHVLRDYKKTVPNTLLPVGTLSLD